MSRTGTQTTGEQHDRLAALTGTLLALRDTADPAAVFGFAAAWASECLGASECRLLRVDPRAGGIWCLDETGLEVPYLPQHDGPVEHALNTEAPWMVEVPGSNVPEADLWLGCPESLMAVPLRSSDAVHGVFLLAFAEPTTLDVEVRALLQTVAASLAQTLAHAELARLREHERRRVELLQRRFQLLHGASSHLVSVVAHEIRSPLTAIKAYAEALLDGSTSATAPRERFLTVINEECDRMARLVADVLDLSRIEAEGRALRLARTGLDLLAEESLETVGPQADARGIQFDLVLEHGLVVEAEPDLIRRLFVNLIGNAVKYSPIGGRVEVRAASGDGWWTGEVLDQGPGVPVEERPRVFERFFRGLAAGDVEGHGLGLAIAKGIVEAHGGRIWVGDRDGAGARFGFTMPARHTATPRARHVARRVIGRAGMNVLLRETVDRVASAMGSDSVSIMLVDPEEGDLAVAVSSGVESGRVVGQRRPLRSGVAGSVAAVGRPLLVNDIEADPRFPQSGPSRYRTKSLLCVPLSVDGEVIGVVNVTSRRTGEPFDEGDLAMLSTLVERVGSAIERACEHPDRGRVMADALAAVRGAGLLEPGAPSARERMRWARAVALELDLSTVDVDLVGYASSVLDFSAALASSAGERSPGTDPAEVPDTETIRPLGYLSRVRDLMLAHHERWDGSGYPCGLRGEAIPLGARILAVVDAYVRMTRGRAYRLPRTAEDAVAQLRAAAGTLFDPRVVEAMACAAFDESVR